MKLINEIPAARAGDYIPDVPSAIELEISAVDREHCADYDNNNYCIIATALRNRGFNVRGVGGSYARLDIGVYDFAGDYRERDLYGPNGIGMKIKMVLAC